MKKLILILLALSASVSAQTNVFPSISRGNAASIPATCLPGRQFYVATDTDALYVCNGTGDGWITAGGGTTPGGSGSQLQFRSSGTALGGISGTSVSGGAITLGTGASITTSGTGSNSATKLQGVDVDATAPTNGYQWVYNTTSSRWLVQSKVLTDLRDAGVTGDAEQTSALSTALGTAMSNKDTAVIRANDISITSTISPTAGYSGWKIKGQNGFAGGDNTTLKSTAATSLSSPMLRLNRQRDCELGGFGFDQNHAASDGLAITQLSTGSGIASHCLFHDLSFTNIPSFGRGLSLVPPQWTSGAADTIENNEAQLFWRMNAYGSDKVGVQRGTFGGLSAQDGNNWLYINNNSGYDVSATQILALGGTGATANTMANGTTYSVACYVGWRTDVAGTPAPKIELIAASSDATTIQSLASTTTTPIQGMWVLSSTVSYTGQAGDVGKYLGVRLSNLSSGTGQANFDNCAATNFTLNEGSFEKPALTNGEFVSIVTDWTNSTGLRFGTSSNARNTLNFSPQTNNTGTGIYSRQGSYYQVGGLTQGHQRAYDLSDRYFVLGGHDESSLQWARFGYTGVATTQGIFMGNFAELNKADTSLCQWDMTGADSLLTAGNAVNSGYAGITNFACPTTGGAWTSIADRFPYPTALPDLAKWGQAAIISPSDNTRKGVYSRYLSALTIFNHQGAANGTDSFRLNGIYLGGSGAGLFGANKRFASPGLVLAGTWTDGSSVSHNVPFRFNVTLSDADNPNATLSLALANDPNTGSAGTTGTALFDISAVGVKIPNSTTLPATCSVGQIYMDTDATSGQRLYACESTNTWVLQGDGGGGGGGLSSSDIDTSAEIAAIVGDHTGSGPLVFGISPTLTTPNLGTPSAVTLTNGTGLPVATGISGLGSGVATLLATFSSANLRSALTDEQGAGPAMFLPSSWTTGDLLLGNGSGTFTRLGIGSNATCLTSNGTTASWGACGAITGSDTHVMFFDGANTPAGEAGMVYNKTTDALTLAGSVKAPFFVDDSADPADSGAIRLGNNKSICWELATPGTDKCLKLDTNDAFNMGSGDTVIEFDAASAPSTPGTGLADVWVDSTDKVLKVKNDAGTVSVTSVPNAGSTDVWLKTLGADGVFTTAQPAFSNLSGSATDAQIPDILTLTPPDNTFRIQDNGDTSKQLAFEVSGVSASTTRTVTIPNSNTTLPIISQVVTVSGPTASRTYTFPDADSTIVSTAATQTLTNKTLTAPIISTISNTGTVTLFTATDTVVGKATTDTLTNKTLNVESTGNVITTVEKIWMPAAGCSGTTGTLLWDTLASNAPTATCSAGGTETTLMRGVADFPDSDGDYSLQQTFTLPDDWTGNIDLKIKYRSTATSGNTVWQATLVCRGDAEVDDAAFNSANTVTDAAKGTTNQLNDAAITSMTTTGCDAGELAHLKVFRNRTHASDTITGVISLAGVEVTMRRAQ